MRSLLLTFIQLILCVLLLLSAYVVKLIGGDTYDTVRSFYYDNLNAEILVDISDEN